jgi:hypothetical protein
VAFAIGVPIAWALLLLLHPGGEGDSIYADVNGDGTRLLVVHVGTMVFIPLLAFAVWLLLEGIESRAADVSRIALALFVVFYVAWEALQGIANGLLVDQVSELAEADRALGAAVIQDFAESPLVRDFGILAVIGSLALVVGMVAAGIALRDDGTPRWTPIVLGIAGWLISAHPPPFGPMGLLLFVVAVFLIARAPAGQPAPAPTGVPRTAGPRAFSGAERAFLIGVPLAWALVLLLHPTGEGEDFYPIIADEVGGWMGVHVGTLVFVPLMAAVVLLLLRGLAERSATIGRVAVGVFAVIYLVWEVLIGLGSGVLVDQVDNLGPADEAVGTVLVEGYTDSDLIGVLETIGVGAWLVALAATGLALVRERGASLLVPLLLVLSAVPTAWHVTPFGQVGLALFVAAVAIVLWGRSSAPVARPAGTPAAA